MKFKKKKQINLHAPNMVTIENPEDPDVVYLELEPHLRLIFRKGEYVGHYDPLPPEPI